MERLHVWEPFIVLHNNSAAGPGGLISQVGNYTLVLVRILLSLCWSTCTYINLHGVGHYTCSFPAHCLTSFPTPLYHLLTCLTSFPTPLYHLLTRLTSFWLHYTPADTFDQFPTPLYTCCTCLISFWLHYTTCWHVWPASDSTISIIHCVVQRT